MRGFWEAMQPFYERSAYVNDLGDKGERRVREAYGPNYERLVALKNKYDPTNFFRLNANVRYWPKADTRGRILGPKFGYPAVLKPLSVR